MDSINLSANSFSNKSNKSACYGGLYIVLIVNNPNTAVPVCGNDDALVDIFYVCKICSTFSAIQSDILNHIQEEHVESGIAAADYMSVINCAADKEANVTGEPSQLNVTIVTSTQKAIKCNQREDVIDKDSSSIQVCSRNDNEPSNELEDSSCEKITSNHLSEVPVKPIFNTEVERQIFENNLEKFDFKLVDGMYTKNILENVIASPTKITELSIFKCNVCKKAFKTESQMRLHCLSHTGLKPYKCTECEFNCSNKANLLSHMRCHTGNMYGCSKCEFKSCNRAHLIEHLKLHFETILECRFCEKTYLSSKSLIHHIRDSHNDVDERQEYLAKFTHKKDGHMFSYKCEVCHRKFKSSKDRERHSKVHKHGQMSYKCLFCEYNSSRIGFLNKHYKKHSLLYFCAYCDVIELSSFKLRAHLEKHNFEPASDPSLSVNVTGNCQIEATDLMFNKCISKSWYLPESSKAKALNENVYIPEVLMDNDEILDSEKKNVEFEEDVFSEKLGMINNLLQKIGYKRLTLPILEKIRETFGEQECQVCGRLFHSSLPLHRHSYTHVTNKPFKCNLCDYSSSSKDNLKRHEEVSHKGKKFTCEVCLVVFNSRSSLWKHKLSHSSAEMECKQCDEKFSNKQMLRNHLLDKHPEIGKMEAKKITGIGGRSHSYLGKQSYKCPYCERLFHGSHSDLQKHIWIHEGIKPFKCPLCPHATRSQNNLSCHMLRHYDFKPFLCEDCGKSYRSKASFLSHIKAHQNSESSERNNPENGKTETFEMQAEQNVNCDTGDAILASRSDAPMQVINTIDGHDTTLSESCDNDQNDHPFMLASIEIENDSSLKNENMSSNQTFDETMAVNIIQQIIQQGVLLQPDQQIITESGQTLLVTNASDDGKKYLIKYVH